MQNSLKWNKIRKVGIISKFDECDDGNYCVDESSIKNIVKDNIKKLNKKYIE